MTINQPSTPKLPPTRADWRWGKVVLSTLLFLLALLLVQTAWMSDDAYITLRTVDNFINGYGLTWNVAERVQAYTHPLWFFLLSLSYAITGDVYYTTLVLSIGLSLTAAALLALRVARSQITGILALASLLLSKSFIDFSTSGLENALTHLLILLFFLCYLAPSPVHRKLFLLSLIAAGSALNRLDSLLFLLPALTFFLVENYSWLINNKIKATGLILLGGAPLLLWEAFSLFYYGFLFPNTFYAKLNTGIPQSELVLGGLSYFVQSARLDPLLPLLIGFALILAVWERTKPGLVIAFGILLYLFYILRIGGDFMGGRFLTAPYLCAVLILSQTRLMDEYRKLSVVWGLILVVGLMWPHSPLRGMGGLQCDIASDTPTDVSDERGCYFKDTGLVNQSADTPTLPNHGWARMGLDARLEPSKVSIMGGVGMFGFFAGPDQYVVDLNALGDPFLARLPVPQKKDWRIGHFERLLPGGYLETLTAGENKICEPNLAEYYDRLRLITNGRLLDPTRLQTIWQINSGQLDHLLAAYSSVASTDGALLCNTQIVTHILFSGGPTLRGFTVSQARFSPGEQVGVTLYWQGETESETQLYSFVHIRNSQPDGSVNPASGNEIWAQAEHLEPGGRLTTEYWPSQIYADQFFVTLPDDIPQGEYFLEVGWFNPNSGEQLDPLDESMTPPLRELWRSVLLPSITVE